MADDKPKVPNPFTAARRSADVTVELSVKDVMRIRPRWSRAEAERFLTQHRAAIGTNVLAAALCVVLALIESEEQCSGPMN